MTSERRPHGTLFIKLAHFLRNLGEGRFTVSAAAEALGERPDSIRRLIERRLEREDIVSRSEHQSGRDVVFEVEAAGLERLARLMPAAPDAAVDAAFFRVITLLSRLGPQPDGEELDRSERVILLQAASDEVRLNMPPGASPVSMGGGPLIDRDQLVGWLGIEEAVQSLLGGDVTSWCEYMTSGMARLLRSRQGVIDTGVPGRLCHIDSGFTEALRRSGRIATRQLRQQGRIALHGAVEGLGQCVTKRLAEFDLYIAIPPHWVEELARLGRELRPPVTLVPGSEIWFIYERVPPEFAVRLRYPLHMATVERMPQVPDHLPLAAYLWTSGPDTTGAAAEQLRRRHPCPHLVLAVSSPAPGWASDACENARCDHLLRVGEGGDLEADIERAVAAASIEFSEARGGGWQSLVIPFRRRQADLERVYRNELMRMDQLVALIEAEMEGGNETLSRRACELVEELGQWAQPECEFAARQKLARALARHAGGQVLRAHEIAIAVLGRGTLLPLPDLRTRQRRHDRLLAALNTHELDRSWASDLPERDLDDIASWLEGLGKVVEGRRPGAPEPTVDMLYRLANSFVSTVRRNAAFLAGRCALHRRHRRPELIVAACKYLQMADGERPLPSVIDDLLMIESMAHEVPPARPLNPEVPRAEAKALIGRLIRTPAPSQIAEA